MPRNLNLVDCFKAILFILMFNLCLTIVRWNKINCVLSILRTSLLPQSQSHIKTRVEFISFSRSYQLKLHLLVILGKSFMYIKNNTGLKTEPCGTPHLIGSILEIVLL